MRFLIALIFCFFCSCTYLDDFIDGTKSLLLKSPEGKDNASADQSKQAETAPQSSEITGIYAGLNVSGLKKYKRAASETVEIFKIKADPGSDAIDILSIQQNGDVLFSDSKSSYKNSYKLMQLQPGFTSVSFAKQNNLLAAAYTTSTDIYDLSSGEKKYSLLRVKSRINSLEFSPDGESLLMAGVDGVVYRWRFKLEANASTVIDDEKSLERYIGHATVVNIVRFHPFGRVIVSSDWEGAINAWLLYDQDKYQGRFDENIFSGRSFTEDINRVRGSRSVVNIIEQIKFSDDGQYFVDADEEGNIEIWVIRGFKGVFAGPAHKGKIYDLSINTNLNRVASVGRDGRLKIWQIEIKDTKVPGIKEYHLTSIKDLSLNDIGSADARKIIYLNKEKAVTANKDGSLNLVDVKI